jgi:hypothetical protein
MRTSACLWPSVCPGSTPLSGGTLLGLPGDGAKIDPSRLPAPSVYLGAPMAAQAVGRGDEGLFDQRGGPGFAHQAARQRVAVTVSEIPDSSL